jgi:hypothetical protein
MNSYYLLSYILSLKLNGNINLCKHILSIVYPYKLNYDMCIQQIKDLLWEWNNFKKPYKLKKYPFYKYNLTKCYMIWDPMYYNFIHFNYRYIRCWLNLSSSDKEECDYQYLINKLI